MLDPVEIFPDINAGTMDRLSCTSVPIETATGPVTGKSALIVLGFNTYASTIT